MIYAGSSAVKNLPAKQEIPGSSSVPGSGRSSGQGNGNPLQYSCLEKSHGQRSLVDYSPWDRKESDTTEQLHFHSHGKMPRLIFTINFESKKFKLK